MESYLPISSRATVAACGQEDELTGEEPVTIAPVSGTTAKLTDLIERLVKRVNTPLSNCQRTQRRRGYTGRSTPPTTEQTASS